MGESFRQELPKISGNIPPQLQEMLGGQAPSSVERNPVGPMKGPASPAMIVMSKLDALQYDRIELPSKGYFYSEDSPLRSGVLHIRPMTGAEEEILATPRYVKRNEAIDMIFRKCLQEQINPSDLITADRTYTLIWLRGISYGHLYNVELKCPACEARFEYNIDLSELPVNYCEEAQSLSGTLPKSGLSFSYRYGTGGDETAVSNYRERRIKNFGGNAVDDTITYRTALLLKNIDDVDVTAQLQILLKRLPIQDTTYIRNLVNDPPFGVDTKITAVCPSCTNTFDVEMPFDAGFFFPRNRKKEEE